MALLAGDGLAWALGFIRVRLPVFTRNRWLMAMTALLLLGLALYPSGLAVATLATPPEPRQRDVAYGNTALGLRSHCAEGQLVGMAEIGLMGYLSDCRVLDFSGLLQPELAGLQLPAADKMAWAIKAANPPLVVLSGGTGYPHALRDAPWFRQRYEPIDNQDERGFFSTIYQRGLGPTKQRDLSHFSWRQQGALRTSDPVPLVFPVGTSPVITLHAYLPPGSTLHVDANGQTRYDFDGREAAWLDYRFPGLVPVTEAAMLTLALNSEQPGAAVAWIESNAIPAHHYFALVDDISQRPRPSVRLDTGESQSVLLAPLDGGPLELELLHRDRPGVQLAVSVDGQEVAVVGGEDGWRWERIALPQRGVAAHVIEITNQSEQFARLAHVALVPAVQSD